MALGPAPIRTGTQQQSTRLQSGPRSQGGGRVLPVGGANRGGNRGGGNRGGGNRGGVLNPLLDPSAQLTGQPLLNAAQNIAGIQVNSPIRDIRGQIGENNRTSAGQQKTDFGYYLQLAKDAKDMIGQSQAAGSQLQGQLSGIAGDTQSQLGQIGQHAQGGVLGRMAGLGLDGGSANALAAQTAQQQGVGALQAENYRSLGASQAANLTGEAGMLGGTVGLAGTEQIGRVASANALANRPLNQKLGDLQASRGQLTATALGQLRGQERNYQIAEQGLGVRNNALQATAAQNQAKNALAARGQNIAIRGQNVQNNLGQARINASNAQAAARNALTANGQNITSARNAANVAYHNALLNRRYGTGAAAKPLSSALNAKMLGQLQTAIGVIHQGQSYRGTATAPLPKGYSEAQIRSGLGQKYHIPDYLIQAAYELVGYGSIDTSTAQYLHSIGLRGGTYNGTPIKVTPRYDPNRRGTGAAVSGAAAPSSKSPLPQTSKLGF